VRIAAVILAFGSSCLAFSFMWQFSTPWYAKVITGTPVLIIFGYLLGQKTIDVPTTFTCPLVPLIPSVGVLVNIYLITSLPIEAFYRVLVWTAIGLAIYFGYGIRNSTLRFRLAAAEDASPADSGPSGQVVFAEAAVTSKLLEDDLKVSPRTAAYSINGSDVAHPDETTGDYHRKFN
jgi:hypothetical protein